MLELTLLALFLAQVVIVPLVASSKGQPAGLWFMVTALWSAMFAVVLFAVVTGSLFSESGLLPWEKAQTGGRIVAECVAGLLMFTPLVAVACARAAYRPRRR